MKISDLSETILELSEKVLSMAEDYDSLKPIVSKLNSCIDDMDDEKERELIRSFIIIFASLGTLSGYFVDAGLKLVKYGASDASKNESNGQVTYIHNTDKTLQ